MRLRDAIPSMFHRRVLLLGVLAAASACALGARVGMLTVARGESLRADAETRLYRWHWTPTSRGRILDRAGRVLAADRPSFDIAVSYEVLSGRWAARRAERTARALAGAEWTNLDDALRNDLRAHCERVYAAHVERGLNEIAGTAGLARADLDDRCARVLAGVERLREAVLRAAVDKAADARRAAGLPVTDAWVRERRVRLRRVLREETQAHAVIRGVDDAVAFAFLRLADQTRDLSFEFQGRERVEPADAVPGLEVWSSGDREYPFDEMTVELPRDSLPAPVRSDGPAAVTVRGVAAHLIGWMRPGFFAEHVQERAALLERDADLRARAVVHGRDRGSYEPGRDSSGQAGVEAAHEHALRGLRGMVSERLDRAERRDIPPEPGSTVRLTIDAELQARVEAILSPEFGLARVQPWHASGSEPPPMPIGTPLNGAAVVLDIASGEILAAASSPGLSRRALRADPEAVLGDEIDNPGVNRALDAAYPPGSIVKPLMLCEAVSRGVVTPGEAIPCTGHLAPSQPDQHRCWIYKQFGATHDEFLGHAPSPEDALMVSCNIYFFTLGRRLGVEGVLSAYRRFGLLEAWNLGAGPEFAGLFGPFDPALRRSRNDGSDCTIGDAIQMAIGQGPVAWTPLHAADAYATLARGGTRIAPRLVVAGSGAPPALASRDAGLDPRAVRAAIEGLRLAVNDRRGTGHSIVVDAAGTREPIFNTPGIEVWGKTGTAAAPDLRVDPDGPEGPEPARAVRSGDHSWFVVVAAREGEPPRVAIAVVMEYAGSGGRVSGPICNQIIRALLDTGYL